MANHMKTTVEISNSLLEEARRLASRAKKTVKALIDEGLRRIIAERKQKSAFKLRKASFKGNGLQPHAAGASWERIRDMIYEEQGG